MRRWILLAFMFTGLTDAADFRGAQFIGFDNFSGFRREDRGSDDGRAVRQLVSPRIKAAISWNELVPSWNYRGHESDGLAIEVKVFYPGRETAWYQLGKWSLLPDSHPRESVNAQADQDGKVDTDTLKLREPAEEFQVRISFTSEVGPSRLNFLGIALSSELQRQDGQAAGDEPLSHRARGKVLSVPERSQVDYPDGINEWCSPTSTSMLLAFWSGHLERADLDRDVPTVARAVHDPSWPGTGNWSFNMAYAGAHDGIRAYAARFSDVSELEDWIEAGIPVAVSVAYGFLKGEQRRGNGHLVVCVGFDEEGNVIVNDPGRGTVRQTYSRENLKRAWNQSRNTVYLVYPEGTRLPQNRYGHWHSDDAQ